MSLRLRNQTCFYSICLLSVFALLLQPGCEGNDHSTGISSNQNERELDQSKKEFDVELQARIKQTEAQFEPYRKNGLVKVTLTPDNGEIFIDNGFVGISKKGLMLPVGTYEIKAVWPDGKQTNKTVFVTPALQQVISWKWNFERNTNGGSGNEKSNMHFDAPLSPTEVTFVKPD